MKAALKTTRLMPVALLAAAAGMAGLWAASGEASQNNLVPARSGLIGIVGGQTLRLSAANVALGGPDTKQPCRVRLGFADAAGRSLTLDPHVAELLPGEATFADLRAPGGGRTEVRPVALGNPDGKSCNLGLSAQIVGEGGQTETAIIIDY
jgi:hypothetical protein